MLSLFQRSFKDIDVRGYDSNLNYADNDRHIPLASLGSFLRTSIDDFPKQPEAYMVPDPERVEHFKSILPQSKKLRVGLSWKTIGARSDKRTIPLSQMAKLLTLPDVEFINLQYGDTTEDIDRIYKEANIRIHDWEDNDPLQDLDNQAALISALDLVITIDNSTLHMAGAVGTPTWGLLEYVPDWRWPQAFGDSPPLYRSVRLFRPSRSGVEHRRLAGCL